MTDREAFDLVWDRLVKEGKVDGRGGAQYRRLVGVWHATAREAAIVAMIRDDVGPSRPPAKPAGDVGRPATSADPVGPPATSADPVGPPATRRTSADKPSRS